MNSLKLALMCGLMAFHVSAVAQSATSEHEPDYPILTGPYFGQEPPGDTPELFAPGLISTCREHSAAMFTPDGNELWFGRMFPAEICYAKIVNGRWTQPQTAPFSGSYIDLYPVLSPHGSKLYFTSDRPVDSAGPRLSRGEVDLWVAERMDGRWSEPRHLGETINIGRRTSCGSIAANGNLYFTTSPVADRSAEMYRSVFVGGVYSEPESLTELNSPQPDHCPFVAPDESYLIFSSFRGGFGRSDLFISFRTSDGSWTEPTNMGARINSPQKDEYPFVTPDGRYLFFNSNRPSALNETTIPEGPGNIYWVDAGIITELRSQVIR